MPPRSSSHDDVTVVIPTFNHGRYLEEAVYSALRQEGGSPRVTVVDDGSTDAAALEVLSRLTDRVAVHRQANAGPSVARNRGMRMATTPLLLPLDADDRLVPGALNALKAGLRAAPSAGFSYGAMRFFGDWEGEVRMPPFSAFRLLYRHTIGVSALMRRELFEDVGGYDEAVTGFEDWEFWLHAVARGWSGHRVNQVTLEYRRHGTTGVNTSARRAYRRRYARFRTKHAALYARSSELARADAIPLTEQLAYRLYWGPRPVPARLEQALHHALWGRRRLRRDVA